MRTLFAILVLAINCNCLVADDLEKALNFINRLNNAVQQQQQQQPQQKVDSPNPNSHGNTIQGNSGASDFSRNNGSRTPLRQPNSNGGYVQPYRAGYGNSGGQYYSEPPLAPIRYSNLPIVISCPEESEGICSYQLLQGSGELHSYTIGGGQKQQLTENASWMIRYEPGPGLPQKTYKLRGGKNYSLQRDPNGNWQCYLAR